MLIIHTGSAQRRPTYPDSPYRTPPHPNTAPTAPQPSPHHPQPACTNTRSPATQPTQIPQPVLRGQEHHRHRRRLRERPPHRHPHQHPLISHRHRTKRTRQQAHHPVTRTPGRSRPAPPPAPHRHPHHHIRQPWIHAQRDQHVTEVHARRTHSDPNLSGSERLKSLGASHQGQVLQRALARDVQLPRPFAGTASRPSAVARASRGTNTTPARTATCGSPDASTAGNRMSTMA